MFAAANDHIVVVDKSISSSQYSSSNSSYEGESAVGDQVGVKSLRKTRKHKSESTPTMRIPLHGGIAAVGASCGNASVAATCGSESPPFEEESQEGQLDGTLRAACRQHVRDGGLPQLSRPEFPAVLRRQKVAMMKKKQKEQESVDPRP